MSWRGLSSTFAKYGSKDPAEREAARLALLAEDLRCKPLEAALRVNSDLVRWRDGSWSRVAEERGHRVNVSEAAKLPLDSNDVVLDVGAHIGTYSRLALQRGVAKVVAVEPDAGNCSVWELNCKEFGSRCELVRAAVADGGSKSVTLYRSNTSSCMHTLFAKRGRVDTEEVRAVSLDELMGGVTKLKFDAEGAEYVVNLEAHLPNLAGLAVEFHRISSLDWRKAAESLIDAIAAAGFRAIKLPKLTDNFHNEGVWVR